MFWYLFQAYGFDGRREMSTITLAYIAIIVFVLMVIGLFLSAREFLKMSDDPSQVVGSKMEYKKSLVDE